jgi:predicted nucleotidyltransferase
VAEPADRDVEQEVIAALRQRGARFGFVFGSQARGDHRPDSDLDVAAWWPGDPPTSYDVPLPSGVDLLVLNKAPLELAGRVAVEGRLLFDDDQAARVRWTAMTRKIYFDELPRLTRAHNEFAESIRRGR